MNLRSWGELGLISASGSISEPSMPMPKRLGCLRVGEGRVKGSPRGKHSLGVQTPLKI